MADIARRLAKDVSHMTADGQIQAYLALEEAKAKKKRDDILKSKREGAFHNMVSAIESGSYGSFFDDLKRLFGAGFANGVYGKAVAHVHEKRLTAKREEEKMRSVREIDRAFDIAERQMFMAAKRRAR